MNSIKSHSAQQRRRLHLNANIIASGRHAAAWRLQTPADTVTDIDHFRAIAQTAERGKLDALFLSDNPSLDESAAERPWIALDPTILLATLAAETQHIGLIATASTTFDQPYHIARRFSSLDHVSRGRAGWNVVTTHHNASAPNFGLENLPEHAERHRRADEFISVVTKLWDSWDADAVVADQSSGRYADLGRVRPINHIGEAFSVRGPLNVPRSPQGWPVVVTAGVSIETRSFAARWADALFTIQSTIEGAREFYTSAKSLTAEAGRDPSTLLVLPGLYPVIGSTEEEAIARKRSMDELLNLDAELLRLANRFGIDPDLLDLDLPFREDILDHVSPHISRGFVENIVHQAWRDKLTIRELLTRNPNGGHRMVVGSPEQIADTMEDWFRTGAADGFNLNMDAYTSGLELFVDHVVPELQRRGLFREDYEATTLRGHLGLLSPAPPRREHT